MSDEFELSSTPSDHHGFNSTQSHYSELSSIRVPTSLILIMLNLWSFHWVSILIIQRRYCACSHFEFHFVYIHNALQFDSFKATNCLDNLETSTPLKPHYLIIILLLFDFYVGTLFSYSTNYEYKRQSLTVLNRHQ